MLDGLAELNRAKQAEAGDPEIATRIRQYEMAYRMQTSVPELADLSGESEETFELYGPDSRRPGSYAANCILARRLAERGVRFIQLFHPDWDHHSRLPSWCVASLPRHRPADRRTHQRPQAAGVYWTTPWSSGAASSAAASSARETGRARKPAATTTLAASPCGSPAAGVKPGLTYGQTDDFSYNVAKDPVHVHDLQATILHLLGIDHTRLTFRSQERDFRLTDVHGKVVENILT